MNVSEVITRSCKNPKQVLTHAPKAAWVGRGSKSALFLLCAASILLVLSARFSVAPLKASSPEAPVVSVLNAQELMSWLENGRSFQLVDARHGHAFDAGHIPAAVSIRHTRLAHENGQEEPIVFYCDGPSVSKLDPCARAIIKELENGSRQVYWLKGGVAAWRSQGYPVEQSAEGGGPQ